VRFRRPTSDTSCYLVYVRPGIEAPEPLAEVLDSEDKVRALDMAVRQRYPELEVRWEQIPWHLLDRTTLSEHQRTLIHVVLTGAQDDEIGVAAFDDAAEADRVVAKNRVTGGDYIRRSVHVGEWLRQGDYPL
jgi:hypothetical protein